MVKASNSQNTVFTWLNAAATIIHVAKLDAATIFESGHYSRAAFITLIIIRTS